MKEPDQKAGPERSKAPATRRLQASQYVRGEGLVQNRQGPSNTVFLREAEEG